MKVCKVCKVWKFTIIFRHANGDISRVFWYHTLRHRLVNYYNNLQCHGRYKPSLAQRIFELEAVYRAFYGPHYGRFVNRLWIFYKTEGLVDSRKGTPMSMIFYK